MEKKMRHILMHKKTTIVLLLILIFNIYGMGQSRKGKDGIDRQRLSSKAFKELISDQKGVLDTLLTKESSNDTYLLDNKKVIVDFGTHAFLYNSSKELRQWIDYLKAKQEQSTPSHILRNRLLYSEYFVDHVNSLVDSVKKIFEITSVIPSMIDLQKIDAVMTRNNRSLAVDESLFSGLVAYVGEVLRNQLPGSKWELVNYKWDTSVWEPYIEYKGKMYNPFFLIYKELFEEYLVTGTINISEAVIAEAKR